MGLAMPTPTPLPDITAIPRAMIAAAFGVVQTVERAMAGDAAVRTAQDNAWEAVCADRARARHRAEVRRLVAEMATTGSTGQPAVGSSPRSSASHAATVPPAGGLPSGAGSLRVGSPVGAGARRS